MAQEQGRTLVPGDNLVIDGVPPVPLTLTARVARYTEFRQAQFFDWHPVRREMLVSTRFGETAQVHQVRFPGGDRSQLTFFPDLVRGAAYEPNTGAYLVFSKDTGGNEFAQNYAYDLDNGEITLLTDGRSKNSLGVWSHAGDKMAYTSTRRTGQDLDIYVIEPASPVSDQPVAEMVGGGWIVLDWSPDDAHLLVMQYVSVNETYLWRLDLKTRERTLLTPRTDTKVAYHAARFSHAGERLWVTTDRDSEFLRLASVEIVSGEHKYWTTEIPWDVESFHLSRDGALIALVTNEAGQGILRVLETATGEFRSLPTLPSGRVGQVRWHSDSQTLAFELVSAGAPLDVYSLDLGSGSLDRWTESETGGLRTEKYSEPELVHWPSFDGREISGFLYRPASHFPKPTPVMIVIHGGPESQFRPMYLGRSNYYLQEMGIALLYPNVRGSSGYGKTFLTLDNGFRREDSYRDIETLFDWIDTQPDLDSDRIFVTGGSYGGHMTLAVATRYSDRIRAALDIVGMSHLVTFLENTEAYRRDLRRAEYGDERDPEMRAFLDRIAPLNHADKITKPLFIVQGKNDPRVPYTEAEQMAETLRRIGTPVWFLMANDEGHGFIKKKNADYLFYATILFLQKYLL